jgi:DNA processing protein
MNFDISEQNHIFAHTLNLLPELGPVRLGRLFRHFDNLERVFSASIYELEAAGIETKIAHKILPKIREFKPHQSYAALKQHNIEVILDKDKNYPQILKEISAHPPILYIRGRIDSLSRFNLGIVGTRKLTSYGEQVLNEIVPALGQNNLNVVSGLAFGVDAKALDIALTYGLNPVAVLASSIDNDSISPRSNVNLAKRIIEQGCLISEYPIGATVQKQNFPQRNRIISGLSVATLVVEADVDSGALITARYALEQNRSVMAVPGSIFSPVSLGTNDLIKRGAKPVTSISDIIQELNLDLAPVLINATTEPLEPQEQKILEALSREPTFIDDLVKNLNLPAAKVNASLSVLELLNRVKNLGGNRYVKIR